MSTEDQGTAAGLANQAEGASLAHANLAITNYRLGKMEQWLGQLAESVTKMASLEERHLTTTQSITRAFEELKSQDDRLTAVEMEMPTLKLVRGWVLALMVGSFSMLVGIVLLLVLGTNV